MKRLLLIAFACLLAFAAGLSRAAEPCYPPVSSVNWTVQSYPVNGPDCLKFPKCFVVQSWHCDLTYRWHSTFKVVRVYAFVPDSFGEYARFLALPHDQKAAIDDKIFHAIDGNDPDFGYTYEVAKMQRDNTIPPPITWVVKAYGTGTRPYYAVVNGVRRTTKAGDVRIGQPCACWRLVKEEGDSRMCDVSGVVAEPPTKLIPENHVALCVRQN